MTASPSSPMSPTYARICSSNSSHHLLVIPIHIHHIKKNKNSPYIPFYFLPLATAPSLPSATTPSLFPFHSKTPQSIIWYPFLLFPVLLCQSLLNLIQPDFQPSYSSARIQVCNKYKLPHSTVLCPHVTVLPAAFVTLVHTPRSNHLASRMQPSEFSFYSSGHSSSVSWDLNHRLLCLQGHHH